MKFSIDRHSTLSIQEQLCDQIKLAIALGRLRPGDTLPSIRDLQEQLRIDKNTAWRVYQRLEKGGILTLKQGKGAQVNSEIKPDEGRDKLTEAERLSAATFDAALKNGIHPSSFLRYFQQYLIKHREKTSRLYFAECNRTEAEFFASQVSDLWGVEVLPLLIDEIGQRLVPPESGSPAPPTILTNIYHLDEVRQVLDKTAAQAIGLRLRWDPRMLERIEELPEPAQVLFLYLDPDRNRYGHLILEEFRGLLAGRRITFAAKGIAQIEELGSLLEAESGDLIFVSNRIWDRVPDEIKSSPRVFRPKMQIEPDYLDHARIRLGIIW